LLIGTDPFARNQIGAGMSRTLGNFASKGAVDIALWDIIGHATGKSVHSLLGGYTPSVRVSHMVGFAPAQEMVDEALAYKEKYGITSFKVKVGRRPADQDVQACIALREALGNDVDLYLDANRGWSANEAQRVAEQCDGYNFLYLEEPCDAQEIMGRRRLVTRSPLTIMADESVPTLGDVARELHTGGASAISIKTARTGFTESQKILGLCEGMGVDVIMGNQIDSMLGSVATVTFGAAFKHSSHRAAELSNFMDFGDYLINEPLEIHEGRVNAPTRPGLGVTLDEAKLSHYRVDGN
jgi:L-alanine-DL-glutamate epimerase-like enolase superfamily enzyme